MTSEMWKKTIFDWQHFLLYIAGPIDFEIPGTADWREEWTKKLINIGFQKDQILNPCKKPIPKHQFSFDYDNEQKLMKQCRESNDFPLLCELVSQVAHIDLRLVYKSDLIIAYFPRYKQEQIKKLTNDFEGLFWKLRGELQSLKKPNMANELSELREYFYQATDIIVNTRVPTYGTIHEIVTARNQHKPCFVIWEGGKRTCSGWMMWLVGHENVFGNIDECVDTMRRISEGEMAYKAKDWLLLDFGQTKG